MQTDTTTCCIATGTGMRHLNPEGVEAYLAHVVDGVSIRELARKADTYPSTILRRIRRVEDLRDDAEVDRFLDQLSEIADRADAMRVLLPAAADLTAAEPSEEVAVATTEKQAAPNLTTAATARRRHKAAALADTALALFARGMTGINLRQRILADRPYDLTTAADGHSLRLYGLETPPCRSETAAILCWAQMAAAGDAPLSTASRPVREWTPALSAASRCDAPVGQRAPAGRGR